MYTILLSALLAFSTSGDLYWALVGPELCASYTIQDDGKWLAGKPEPCHRYVGKSSMGDYGKAMRAAENAAEHTLEACFRADKRELFCFPIHRGKGGV